MRALTLVLLFTLAATSASAQTRVGLGIQGGADGLLSDGFFFGGLSSPALLIPIDINEVVRVEPSFGISSTTRSLGRGSFTTRTTQLGLGVGAIVPAPGISMTFGAKARYARLVTSGSEIVEDVTTVFAIGPAVTGEYPFSERFRLGADVGFEYRTYDGEDSSPSNIRQTSGYGTTAGLSVRFFLF